MNIPFFDQHAAGRRGAGTALRVALCAALSVFAFAAMAQAAGATATLSVTTDAKTAGSATAVTINTALSGTGNDTHQYGASVTIPPNLNIQGLGFGGSSDRCPSSSFSTLSTGITPTATAFSNASCPSAAKVGTVTLGAASGSIYVVDASPLPQFGIYFDSGVTPYGRKLGYTVGGSNETTLIVNGLNDVSTSGLTMTFNNPSRPTLMPKIWAWVVGYDPACAPSANATGNVWTWPTSGTTATNTSMSAVALTEVGCGISYDAFTDVSGAGTAAKLTLQSTLAGTGNDTKQYGASFTVPPQINIYGGDLGSSSDQCPGSSFSSLSTGYTPAATAFSNASCPASARVGTATLGSTSGGIYVVNASPLPSFGVYFDTGVGTPYGRKLNYNVGGSNESIMSIFGLPNSSSSGLKLEFYSTTRGGTFPTKIWHFVAPGTAACTNAVGTGTAYTFPASGTATDATTNYDYIPINGCNTTFDASTDVTSAGSAAALTLTTTVGGSGYDLFQYGQRIIIPPQLTVQGYTLGSSSQQCPSSSFSSYSSGYTPAATAFSNASCPAEAKIGTATYGGISGSIYVVSASPLPQFGIYFDTGTGSGYGRRLSWSVDGNNNSILSTYGLGFSSGSGLTLVFNNPSRPTLPAKTWGFVTTGDPGCSSQLDTGNIYNYPASGTASVMTTIYDALPITGC